MRGADRSSPFVAYHSFTEETTLKEGDWTMDTRHQRAPKTPIEEKHPHNKAEQKGRIVPQTRVRTATRSAAVIICLLVSTVLLFACSPAGSNASGSAQQDSATSTETSRGSSKGYAGLPTTISSYGNSYTIADLAISENESGNTVVTCTGSGFERLPMRNNKMVIPVYCSIIENGTETEFKSFGTKSGEVTFTFGKKLNPETVVFYSPESKDKRTEVKVK